MKIDNKFLRNRIPPINFDNPLANQQLALLLTRYMQQNRAVGLAANQVGYNRRVFVMQIANKIYHCFNPEIVSVSNTTAVDAEGCLSFPKLRLSVARPESIVVQYADFQGNISQEELSGLAARCFQHELDHLNGITMHQRHKENANVQYQS